MINMQQQNVFFSGWLKSPYDRRDWNFKEYVPLEAVDIPANYESEQVNYVFDQGDSNQCCACAFSSLRYLQESKQSGLTKPFSPIYTYGTRDPIETYEGMYLRNCLKKARTAGSILYSDLPGFCSTREAMNKVKQKQAEYLAKGNPYRISGFYACRSREAMQTAIITCMGFMTGIPIYESAYNVKSDGVVNYNPDKDVVNFGGHCILVTGWRTDSNGKLWWRCLNSWGHSYGDGGYFWLPEEYPLVEECFTVTDSIMEITFAEYRKKFGYK